MLSAFGGLKYLPKTIVKAIVLFCIVAAGTASPSGRSSFTGRCPVPRAQPSPS